MKKMALFIIVFTFFFYAQLLGALVLESELNTSNFALKGDGSYRTLPDFGGSLLVEEQILPHFNVRLAIERDSEIGNTIWSTFSYKSSVLEISLGPSLGILNSVLATTDILSSFQPGIAMGLHIATENGFIAGFAGNFAVAVANASDNFAFLQSGSATLGYRFPNLLSELRFSHKGKVGLSKGYKSFFSITDYGLYTETFSKPSRLKVPLNVIFRHIRYTSSKAKDEKKSYGNILLEAGLKFTMNSDVEVGFLCGASVYSFVLGNERGGIQKFFFRSKCSVKVAL